jgi:hypothetical protein
VSKPLWIPCPSVDDVPSVSQLQQLVTDEQHVVLKLLVTPDDKGTAVDKPSIIQHLARQLPDFTVFDSGGKSGESTWITIKKVIAGEDVLANAEAILAAMRLFRATARDLMGRLAQQLNVPLEVFADPYFRLRRAYSVKLSGNLGERTDQLEEESRTGPFRRLLAPIRRVLEQRTAEWEYQFHGAECQFRNTKTGQILEICLGFGDESGVLDPYFFYQFVSTTPGLEKVAKLFSDSFHDTRRALKILEQRGHLRQISSPSENRVGLIAPVTRREVGPCESP